jgi:glycerophosphoryl diester phosphodiesterase
MQIVAHRGASRVAPENTLAAITRAWEIPEVAVEIDVHLTADGKIVVIRDSTTGRTAGKNLAIEASTLAALRTLDYGSWKGGPWEGETIPTLEDVLDLLPDDRMLVVNIRSDARILPVLQEVVHEFDMRREQIRFVSTSELTLDLAGQALPENEMIFLGKPQIESIEQTARNALVVNADGIAVYTTEILTPQIVEVVHRMGLSVHARGVDGDDHARRALDAEVDSCTTDNPRWLRGVVEAARQQEVS